MILGGYRILVILGLFFFLCDITSVAGVKRCHQCKYEGKDEDNCKGVVDCSKSNMAKDLMEERQATSGTTGMPVPTPTVPTDWACFKEYGDKDGVKSIGKGCAPPDDKKVGNKCETKGTGTFCICDDTEECNGGPPMAKTSLASLILLLGVCVYNL